MSRPDPEGPLTPGLGVNKPWALLSCSVSPLLPPQLTPRLLPVGSLCSASQTPISAPATRNHLGFPPSTQPGAHLVGDC